MNRSVTQIKIVERITVKVYTRKGDKGRTSIIGGRRLDKDDLRIESYGTVDELNSIIGHLRSLTKVHSEELKHIQNILFEIGSELASQEVKGVIDENDIKQLEHWIDQMEEQLPPLKNFILPGGTLSASQAHIARTVTRRAERKIVSLSKINEVPELVIAYMNRLSDYLFVLARYMNLTEKTEDTLWSPRS